MKTLKLFLLSTAFILFAQSGYAQVKSETLKVAGECGMCKKKIETAAKSAGATYAVWNEDSKELKVKYNSKSSNAAKIQESIAAVGYDTESYKATEEAYNNLHSCCKYDRTSMASASCCVDGKCTKEECKTCCKDGVCTKDMACCKNNQCADHAKTDGKAACCKKA
jgi:periplasmic mercuric ion binding protein